MNSKIFNEVNKMINTIIFEIQCSILNHKDYKLEILLSDLIHYEKLFDDGVRMVHRDIKLSKTKLYDYLKNRGVEEND